MPNFKNTLDCPAIPASQDVSDPLKQLILPLASTAGNSLPSSWKGFALKALIKAVWPHKEDEIYRNLFEVFLYRTKNYIDITISNYLKITYQNTIYI